LQAEFRVALTGTPVENRLTELWSIAEFLNPGMLGSYEGFRREIAIPIERFAREDVAERLKHIVRPLILRRVKSDASIIQDLPPKQEMTVYCTLTREQASLYQAELDAAMENIENADGIARRGQVLALITALKQICNHPAQYLREAGPLGGRSGKMERLREMLEEALAAGDRVLVFTQYREMGARLVSELTRHFGSSIQYLHGGTPRATRDVMIRRFQEQANGPRIFVLSLKAGGTGLNLTAATHVFHYDRWWNPAVEDQATDRAYRIGQQRKVQVHKFLCAGTIEERVNQMLEAKRDLAARIVGQGEQWITELNNDQLRELFSLAPNAFIGSEENGSDEADAEGESVSKPSARRKRSKSKDGMATKLPTADEFA
jgi:SNF2 family DNA or RNA helicase